jgi:hypothetical protein
VRGSSPDNTNSGNPDNVRNQALQASGANIYPCSHSRLMLLTKQGFPYLSTYTVTTHLCMWADPLQPGFLAKGLKRRTKPLTSRVPTNSISGTLPPLKLPAHLSGPLNESRPSLRLARQTWRDGRVYMCDPFEGRLSDCLVIYPVIIYPCLFIVFLKLRRGLKRKRVFTATKLPEFRLLID